MHIVERYHLIDAKEAAGALERQEKIDGFVLGNGMGAAPVDPRFSTALRVEVTVGDPNIFTTPWSAM